MIPDSVRKRYECEKKLLEDLQKALRQIHQERQDDLGMQIDKINKLLGE